MNKSYGNTGYSGNTGQFESSTKNTVPLQVPPKTVQTEKKEIHEQNRQMEYPVFNEGFSQKEGQKNIKQTEN